MAYPFKFEAANRNIEFQSLEKMRIIQTGLSLSILTFKRFN
jgi:hypothetical protein